MTSGEYEDIRIDGLPEMVISRATTARSRRRGLIGIERLPLDRGLLLTNAPLVHMAGMQSSLALVFLNSKWAVVKICYANPGLRLHGSLKARHCLELAPEAIALHSIAVGEKLEPVH